MAHLNGTRHPVFRLLDAAEVEDVVEESYRREEAFLQNLHTPKLVVDSTAVILAIIGAVCTFLTVVRGGRKEKQFQSRFYKLLCVNVFIQAVVMIGELARSARQARLLFSSKDGHYSSLFLAAIGCFWSPIHESLFCLMFANILCIVAERFVTVFAPLWYQKKPVKYSYLFLFVQYAFVLLFLTPLTIHTTVKWQNVSQAYVETYHDNWWNHKILYPLYGFNAGLAKLNHGAMTYANSRVSQYAIATLGITFLGNVCMGFKVWRQSKDHHGESIARSKATIKLLGIMFGLLVVGYWPMVSRIAVYIARYVSSGYTEVVCRRMRGFEGVVSNLTEPCTFLAKPCFPELEFATLADVDRFCRNDESLAMLVHLGLFTTVQLSFDFYVYIALVSSFRQGFLKYVCRVKGKQAPFSTNTGTAKKQAWT